MRLSSLVSRGRIIVRSPMDIQILPMLVMETFCQLNNLAPYVQHGVIFTDLVGVIFTDQQGVENVEDNKEVAADNNNDFNNNNIIEITGVTPPQ